MNSPVLRFRLIAAILYLNGVRVYDVIRRSALLAFCIICVFNISTGWVMFTAVSMRLGAVFIYKQGRDVIRKTARLSSLSISADYSSSRKDIENLMRGVKSLDTRLLTFDKISRLQVPVIKRFYFDCFGIRVCDSDAELLACFSDIGSVAALLQRSCGISERKYLGAAELRRVGIIFPVFLKILSMHKMFITQNEPGGEGLPETGNLYPLHVSIEEHKAARTAIGYKWLGYRHELCSVYENMKLEVYLNMLAEAGTLVSNEGSFESRARYKRFLTRSEKIHRLRGENYEQLD